MLGLTQSSKYRRAGWMNRLVSKADARIEMSMILLGE